MTREEQKAVEEFAEMNLTKKGLYHYNDMQDAFLIGLFKGEKMQSSLPSNIGEAAEVYANRGISFNADPYEETIAYQADKDAFKAGAEWQREQYECIPTEEAYMRGFAQGAKEEREAFIPLINRLCEAILFEWEDAAEMARKTLTQIKEVED